MSRWPNRDTISWQENFSKMEIVTRFYPNVTRFWWCFKIWLLQNPIVTHFWPNVTRFSQPIN